MSDGVRAIHLRPGLVQGHICYIVALDALGKVTEVGMAKQEFNKRFPAHRFELLRAMEVEKSEWSVCVCAYARVHVRTRVCACVLHVGGCPYICDFCCLIIEVRS